MPTIRLTHRNSAAGHGVVQAPQRIGSAHIHGVGMLEFLVALLVFSTVLSAVMATQLTARRIGADALQRSVATALAQDILERIRANARQVQVYEVEKAGDIQSPLEAPSVDCGSLMCTPTELATYDLWHWEGQLMGVAEKKLSVAVGGLVAPRACIRQADGVVTIAISWLGMSSSTQSHLSDCGSEEEGLYDAQGASIGNNLRRRQLSFTHYLGGQS